MTYKVIAKAREDNKSDILICNNSTKPNARKIAEWFNEFYGERHDYYFIAKPETYILKGEEND